MVIVFYLARDRESGQIIDDGFLTPLVHHNQTTTGDYAASDSFMTKEGRRSDAENHASIVCSSWNLDLIAVDGPYWEYLWRLGFRKPKWASGPPPGISTELWAKRLKSTDELAAYRAGVQAGSKPKSRER
jgi:hypothetical protein